MNNIKKKAENLIHKAENDAGFFLLDYFKFLVEKGKKDELDNLILDFSVSLKRPSYECSCCHLKSNGNKYICSHCFKEYCQRCFDVNKIIKKHPHTFYADSGCDDLEHLKKIKLNKDYSINKRHLEKGNDLLISGDLREKYLLTSEAEKNKESEKDVFEKEKIEKMIERLDRLYKIKNKYTKEDMINAIKTENYDEERILNRLFSMDEAHL